nr:hypothetical protein [Mycoplasmopsis bovis]
MAEKVEKVIVLKIEEYTQNENASISYCVRELMEFLNFLHLV